ncbi:alpha/beta hydrolase [Jejudonia soesokkakensis]|uniref:Alpha/beta hydrolase n=1 Tax=Jejudonia soesokkakensis TaxID=1323432 RepID=A0ABW2MTE4_9FLAO
MSYKTHVFTARDGEHICYYHWKANEQKPLKGMVQIAHGIGEYAGRYDAIAQLMADEGYEVYANDHRAHGKTAEIKRLFGHYDGADYFGDCMEDMHELAEKMRADHPKVPFVLFGHSMGSLLSRKFVTEYAEELDGLILSGTASFIKGLGNFGILATGIVTKIRGRERKNDTLKDLFFGEFNKKFSPNRTKFDWLSTVEEEVDKFEADPYRVEDFSLGVFQDVIKNSKKLNEEPAFQATPTSLPILVFSGKKDPVGEMGKGVKQVVKKYKNCGVEDLTVHLYEEGRHEMLKEKNKEEVQQDILNWLKAHI